MKECVEHGIGKDDYDYINACTIHVCTIVHTKLVQIVHTSVITKYFYLTSMGLRETEIS